MRVLLTTDTVGGVWTFTKELTGELLHCGHAVALVSFGRLPSREQTAWCAATLASHPRVFHYETSSAPLEWMESNENAYAAGESLLLRVAREFSPDILHSSQFCFGKLPIAIPKIVTAHSDVLSWSEACKPKGLVPSAWLTRYCGLVQDGLAGSDAVVAPTQWMLAALGRNFALPRARHAVLNGRTLSDAKLGGPRNLRAISAGRVWDEAKNLAALANLNSPIPILIVGEQQMEASTDTVELQPVRTLGPLSEADLLKLFCSSSLYIAASLYEPFGLAPLEAALCGCAVVANEIASLREIWGDAALYFHDRSSLCALLQELKLSPALLRAARAHSFERAQELTAARMAGDYVALYQNLLGDTPAAALSPMLYEEQGAHVS